MKERKLSEEQRELVEKNHWLAVRFARDWRRGRLDFDERLSLAYQGMCRAAITFDSSRGAFSTHSYRWMAQEIGRALREDFTIHIPDYINYKSDDDPKYKSRRVDAARARACKSLPCDGRKVLSPGDGDTEDAERIAKAMENLPKRTRHVIEQMVLEGRTLKEVGDEMGRTKERVRQLKEKGLMQLRRILS